IAVTTLPIGLTSCAQTGSDEEPASASKRPKRPAIVLRPSIYLLLSRRARFRPRNDCRAARGPDRAARLPLSVLPDGSASRINISREEPRRQQNGAFPTAESHQ